MAGEDLHKFLSSNDKQKNSAKGVLSHLFRQILTDVNMTPMVWNKLMRRYLSDSRNGVPDNSKDRSSHRGNLNKELRRADITWRVFEKGIRFLNPQWFRITIDIGWPSGRVTTHSVTVPTHRRPASEIALIEEVNPVDPGFRQGHFPFLDDPEDDEEEEPQDDTEDRRR